VRHCASWAGPRHTVLDRVLSTCLNQCRIRAQLAGKRAVTNANELKSRGANVGIDSWEGGMQPENYVIEFEHWSGQMLV
jgi:hypothetical protein